jgi:ribonuclease HI
LDWKKNTPKNGKYNKKTKAVPKRNKMISFRKKSKVFRCHVIIRKIKGHTERERNKD